MPPRRRRPPAGAYADPSSDSSARPSDDEEESSDSSASFLGRPQQRRRVGPQQPRRAAAAAGAPQQHPAAQQPRRAAAVPVAAAAAAHQPRQGQRVAAAAQQPAAVPAVLPQDPQIDDVAANLGFRRNEDAQIDQLRQILSDKGILYLDDYTLDELSRLALMLVKRQGYVPNQDPRPPEIQVAIDQHYRRNGADARLSIHELNEYATTMDYIIKIKANIFGIRRLIRENDDRINITTMRDDDTGQPVLDVWAYLPPTLPYQVCQGTAMQHFSKYLCIFD